MSWHGIEHALVGLVASGGSVLEGLPKPHRGLVLLLLCLSAGWGAGVTTMAIYGDYITHPERIEALEEWRVQHLREETEPGLARIQVLEDEQEAFRGMWEQEWDLERGGRLAVQAEMVREMYCSQWPEKCRAIPREE